MARVEVRGEMWGREMAVRCPVCERMISIKEVGCKHLVEKPETGGDIFIFEV